MRTVLERATGEPDRRRSFPGRVRRGWLTAGV